LNFAVRRILRGGVFAACLAGLAGPAAAHSLGGGVARSNAVQAESEGAGQGREFLFKVINFVILAGGLGYILRKPLRDFFSTRSDSIRKGLDEGRKALEASRAQLEAVEERLRHLEEEIAAFKASAAVEVEAERERLRQAAAEETEKVLESARARIETAVRAARLELKSYAAKQAVGLAGDLIRGRLDDSGRRYLVSQFVASLEAKDRRN
jgi:F-type H+-transporting ATPase subunit b